MNTEISLSVIETKTKQKIPMNNIIIFWCDVACTKLSRRETNRTVTNSFYFQFSLLKKKSKFN